MLLHKHNPIEVVLSSKSTSELFLIKDGKVEVAVLSGLGQKLEYKFTTSFGRKISGPIKALVDDIPGFRTFQVMNNGEDFVIIQIMVSTLE
ncbi:MAG: hypothetical protein U0U66_13905 [Cytophagaceae bacterium]